MAIKSTKAGKSQAPDQELLDKLTRLESLLVQPDIAARVGDGQLPRIASGIALIRARGPSAAPAQVRALLELLDTIGAAVKAENPPAIFAVAAKGDLEGLKQLIKAGADVHATLSNGTTALMTAVENGHDNIVQELIKSGVDVNQRRQDTLSALLLAGFLGQEDIVKTLVKKGADVDARHDIPAIGGTVGNNTVLIVAAQRANLPMCKLLLKLGASIDAMTDVGYTPLIASLANSGSDEMALYLLQSGANPDPDVVSKLAFSPLTTPLVLAATNGLLDVVKDLIRRKVRLNKPDGRGWTALKHASRAGHPAIVKALIKGGADLDLADDEGWTPLMAAAVEGHSNIVKLLLKAGAKPNIARAPDDDAEARRTALMDSAFAGHLECVEELLKSGADPDQQMQDGRAALHSAIMGVHPEVVAALLASKADPNLRTAAGTTPLQFAIGLIRTDEKASEIGRADLLQIVKLLLDFGADTGLEIVGVATGKGHAAVLPVKEQLSLAVAPNAAKSNGLPVLHIAAQHGLKPNVQTLLDGGANVMARSAFGVLAYDVAVAYGKQEMARVLIRHMNSVASPTNLQDAKGRTKLLRSVLSGNLALVKEAIADGADASRRDMEGCTPLSIAIEMKSAPIVLALRTSGAETIDTADLTAVQALIKAAKQGALGSVLRALDDGASIEGTDEEGNTPLLIAATSSHPGLLRALVAMGANIEHRNAAGMTAYMIVASASRQGIVKILEESGSSTETADKSLLDYANEGNTKACIELLDAGEDIEQANHRGTSLHLAALECHVDTCIALLARGADVNALTFDDETPLHFAAMRGNVGVCSVLLEHGAEIDAQDNAGQTPLHFASIGRNALTFEYLLQRGADIDIKDFGGQRPRRMGSPGKVSVQHVVVKHKPKRSPKSKSAATVRSDLEAIVGKEHMTPADALAKLRAYIRTNELWDPDDNRYINADEKLKAIFQQDKLTMHEMSPLINSHFRVLAAIRRKPAASVSKVTKPPVKERVFVKRKVPDPVKIVAKSKSMVPATLEAKPKATVPSKTVAERKTVVPTKAPAKPKGVKAVALVAKRRDATPANLVAAAVRTLCISGKLPSGLRKSDYDSALLNVGVKLVDDVIPGLTYLALADPNSTSAKAEKARRLGARVISEDQLIAMASGKWNGF